MAGLNVGKTVERIEQESPGTFVEGDGHRVGGEVAAAEVFKDGRPVVDGLAGFGIFLTAGGGDLDADAAGEPEEEGAGGLVIAPECAAGFLERLPELESISLNCKIEVADGEAAGEIANRATGEEEGHARVAGGVSNLAKGVLLSGGKAIFKKVDVIGHGCRRFLLAELEKAPPVLPGSHP